MPVNLATVNWSDRAYLAHKHTPPSAYQIAVGRMERGPFIAADGYTLVVPSEFYHAEAAAFWKAHGFTYRDKEWQRDTRRPFKGKVYTAQAWLESARRKFDEFWN
jgi:hypothetical protein